MFISRRVPRRDIRRRSIPRRQRRQRRRHRRNTFTHGRISNPRIRPVERQLLQLRLQDIPQFIFNNIHPLRVVT